ncbi:MAG: hypothetical protein V1728_02605 [Candidatus Micrarchaeota archaeon]
MVIKQAHGVDLFGESNCFFSLVNVFFLARRQIIFFLFSGASRLGPTQRPAGLLSANPLPTAPQRLWRCWRFFFLARRQIVSFLLVEVFFSSSEEKKKSF